MEAIISLFESYLSDELVLRRTVVIVVAIIIFILGIGLSVIFLGVTNPIRRRLHLINETEENKGALSLKIATAVGPIASFILPKEDLERDKVKRDLYRAGFHSPQALQVFYAIKAVLTVGLALVALAASRFLPSVTTQSLMLYVAVAAAVGLLTPNYVLSKALERHMRLLRNGFPDADSAPF